MRKLLIVGMFFSLFFSSCKEHSKLKPNIVLILVDDLGIPQLGCYGSSFYKTPNIDKLAQEGAKFTQAYSAASVCSPTRAALLTGKYPARLHITDFIAGNNDSNYPLLEPNWQKFLPIEETTIAEVLKGSGYETALFGKWHLSKQKTPPVSLEHNPDKQGFDETFVTYKPENNLPLGAWQTAEKDAHSVDTLTSIAINFIKRNKDSPFFLVVSHNSIHDPLMEKETSINRFNNLYNSNEPENNPVWGAMVERIDKNLGRLQRTIADLNLEEKTIVIFYSDNGAKDKYAKQTPFRKGKGWLYEGGIRVPLLIKWKGEIEEGILCDTPIITMDFFSTLLDATSSQRNDVTDGINIFSALKNKQNHFKRNLYWNYPHYHKGSGMKPACAIRSGDYKLIKWYEPYLLGQDSIYELFNLKNDIGESYNLAYELPQKVKDLDQLLEEWKEGVNAQEPTKNLHYTE